MEIKPCSKYLFLLLRCLTGPVGSFPPNPLCCCVWQQTKCMRHLQHILEYYSHELRCFLLVTYILTPHFHSQSSTSFLVVCSSMLEESLEHVIYHFASSWVRANVETFSRDQKRRQNEELNTIYLVPTMHLKLIANVLFRLESRTLFLSLIFIRGCMALSKGGGPSCPFLSPSLLSLQQLNSLSHASRSAQGAFGA